jgi:hypothetical protein
MTEKAHAKANHNYLMFDPNSQMVDHTNTHPNYPGEFSEVGRPENGPLPNENPTEAYRDAPVEVP